MKCGICPHECSISEDHYGTCGTRKNHKGKITDEGAGILSALSMDPIEKKPLYHFYPGRQVLSAGFFGCNLKCPFCQNHSISQSFSKKGKFFSPEELIQAALENGSFGIAYTYSEPLIHYEYILECSKVARAKGLKNILITNGMINPSPGEKLLELTDAANIDLKSFNPDFYKNELKGKLEPVLEFIRSASKKTHLEITTLVIPGKTDSPEEISEISKFISDLNPNIPFHLSAYYPQYKYSIPATSAAALIDLVEIAGRYLPYVYPGNIGSGSQDTKCKHCGHILIRRSAYSTDLSGLKGKNCASCGTESPLIL